MTKNTHMPGKISSLFLIMALASILFTCEFSYKEIIYFDEVGYTITGIEATDTTLFVSGLVENTGNFSFKAPWYLTYDLSSVGGSETKVYSGVEEMLYPLDCGGVIAWEARYDYAIFEDQASIDYNVGSFEAYHILD